MISPPPRRPTSSPSPTPPAARWLVLHADAAPSAAAAPSAHFLWIAAALRAAGHRRRRASTDGSRAGVREPGARPSGRELDSLADVVAFGVAPATHQPTPPACGSGLDAVGAWSTSSCCRPRSGWRATTSPPRVSPAPTARSRISRHADSRPAWCSSPCSRGGVGRPHRRRACPATWQLGPWVLHAGVAVRAVDG